MKNYMICLFLLLMLTVTLTTSGFAQVSFIEHPIAEGYNCWRVHAIDIDNDGDIDAVGSSRTGSRVA